MVDRTCPWGSLCLTLILLTDEVEPWVEWGWLWRLLSLHTTWQNWALTVLTWHAIVEYIEMLALLTNEDDPQFKRGWFLTPSKPTHNVTEILGTDCVDEKGICGMDVVALSFHLCIPLPYIGLWLSFNFNAAHVIKVSTNAVIKKLNEHQLLETKGNKVK